MGLLDGLFGPSHEAVWQEVVTSLGGTYTPGSFLRTDHAQVWTKNGIITLDLESRGNGQQSTTYTRFRAPFVNRLGHRLRIYRSGWFSELGKLLGTQDIELGDLAFDTDFIVQGSSPEWVQVVLDPTARRLIQRHDRFFLETRFENSWFGTRYPPGVEGLVFEVPEIIRDADRLRALFELLDHLLRRIETVSLSHLDLATRQIAILSGPGGQVTEGERVLWEGLSPRRLAAAELGRLRERKAVPALIRAVHDPDPGLCSAAVAALGEIGAPEAVPTLVALLGADPHLRETTLSGQAARALTKLGEAALVNAFQTACRGQLADTGAPRAHRQSFVAALSAVLEGNEATAASGAAVTLAQLGAVEALDALQRRFRRLNREQTALRGTLERAIAHLESLSRLPRPSVAPAVDLASLPRAASEVADTSSHDLPRPASHSRTSPENSET